MVNPRVAETRIRMKLRTLVLLALFVLGLIPMAAVIVLNLPMVLSSFETLIYRGHLQNLRVEFSDLDQFTASRKEMVRFLAKLPGPALVDHRENESAPLSQASPDTLIQLINQILEAGQDIYEVLFLDRRGQKHFHLVRDQLGQPLRIVQTKLHDNYEFYLRVGLSMTGEGVYLSPIKFLAGEGHREKQHAMIMRMVSPILSEEEGPVGVVLISLDVGGLPSAYPNAIWVMNNGRYLPSLAEHEQEANAFMDYPGLEELFSRGTLALWRGEDRQRVIWIPLFLTEGMGPLWVGRSVDPTDIETFQAMLQERVLIVFAVLFVSVLILARWIAMRVARYSEELKQGIEQVLDQQSRVVFSWRGPKELQLLARDLTRLADTHAKTTQALYERAHELEESNRYKSEFLANMSHELRTPLNSILLLSKLLADNSRGNLSGEQVKQLQVIHASGSDLLNLIEDILDVSKIEAKKTAVRLRVIDIHTFWRPLFEMFEPLAVSKDLNMNWRIAEDAPKQLLSDQEKLCQILKNFLSNAIKFTNTGGILLEIERNHGEDAQLRPLVIRVRDSGIGIPKEKQAVIFEAFRQADGATNRRYGGTGLGLAISNGIANLLGGRVEVESEEGWGSTFSLFMPLEFDVESIDSDLLSYAASEEREEFSTKLPERPVGHSPLVGQDSVERGWKGLPQLMEWPLHGKRILVVEDDLDYLLRLTPLLESWGLQVTAAGSGDEAVETLAEDRAFDLLLIDTTLPTRGGLETYWCLREDGVLATMGVIILSLERSDGLSTAGVAVLPKPAEAAALERALRAALLASDRSKKASTGA